MKEKKNNRRPLSKVNGQGMIEYIILTTFVGIVCLAATRTLGTKMKDKMEALSTKIKNIKVD